MAALSNILPIVSLGSCCIFLLVLFGCRCWRRASRLRPDVEAGNPDYEVEEIPGTTDFVMVGRKGHRKKKVKKPKLWDIWAPNPGRRPAHERKLSSGSSLSDFSLGEDVGNWAELKVSPSRLPISTGYSELIFVSGSPYLSPMSKTKTRPKCHLSPLHPPLTRFPGPQQSQWTETR